MVNKTLITAPTRSTHANEETVSRGTAAFRAIAICMTLAGLSTFALMNCVQPLMPFFAQGFAISAAQSSLSMSVNIGALALCMPFASIISERVGRKPVLVVSMFASGLACITSATAQSWEAFLAYRALQGVLFAGVPAIAMAYIAEEISSSDTGYAAGLYVGGAAVGGLAGRVIAGLVAGHWGWQASIAVMGAVGVVSAALFKHLLPPSRHFAAMPVDLRQVVINYRRHLNNRNLLRAYLTAFMMMGSFVIILNLIGFRLTEAPFSLGHRAISALFLTSLAGIYASAFAGRMADRYGIVPVSRCALMCCAVGVLLMASASLPLVVIGLLMFTVGFFAAHCAANGSVSRYAAFGKSQASTLYFISYYIGGAVLGWVGGVAWAYAAWPGVTAVLAMAVVVTFALGFSNRRAVG